MTPFKQTTFCDATQKCQATCRQIFFAVQDAHEFSRKQTVAPPRRATKPACSRVVTYRQRHSICCRALIELDPCKIAKRFFATACRAACRARQVAVACAAKMSRATALWRRATPRIARCDHYFPPSPVRIAANWCPNFRVSDFGGRPSA